MALSIFKRLRDQIRSVIGATAYEQLRYHYYRIFVPDTGYSRNYYLGGEEANAASYPSFVHSVNARFHPKVVADVGAGSGGMSKVFRELGCEVHPFDGSGAAIGLLQEKGFTSAQQIDLLTIQEIPVKADLCLCLEVAEHIPEKHAPQLCKLLAGAAPVLIFTAAPPSQGGHLHVNLQEQSYWFNLMAEHGMIYDQAEVEAIRAGFGAPVGRDYDRNLMVFKRR